MNKLGVGTALHLQYFRERNIIEDSISSHLKGNVENNPRVLVLSPDISLSFANWVKDKIGTVLLRLKHDRLLHSVALKMTL